LRKDGADHRSPPSRLLAFKSPAALRAWFEKNHDAAELWIRFYKLDLGKPSVSYPEALDEALCVGWIDGVRKRADDESYIQRFTPRKPRSDWSTVNINKAKALLAAGRMRPSGLAAFKARDASAARRYAFENRPDDLPTFAAAELRKYEGAWRFWEDQPPSYRKAITWWIVSAKREETRAKRIAILIEHMRRAERIPLLVSPTRKARDNPP